MKRLNELCSFLIMLLAYLSIISQTNLFASEDAECHIPKTNIYKIDSLDQIAISEPSETIYFFDIDDTIFDSPSMLGSKAWRKYIVAATQNDLSENWHDLFSLYLARNYPLETVEIFTSSFISELQMNGCMVFGLTARERQKWYDTPMNEIDLLTVNQLESVGISFNNELLEKKFPDLLNYPEYYKGVFFADIEPKGGYLLKLFQDFPQLPQKVIFVDDKLSQIESVAAALQQLGISYECYWYTATDPKAEKYDPLIANIQLYYFWISKGKQIISDEEANSIANQYPDRNADFYLESLLENAK